MKSYFMVIVVVAVLAEGGSSVGGIENSSQALNTTSINTTESSTALNPSERIQRRKPPYGMSPSTAFRCSEGIDLMRFIIEVVLTMTISVFGIIGNLLAFCVLCRQNHNSSTKLLLQVLCIVDIFLLFLAMLTRSRHVISSCFGLQYQIHFVYMYIFPVVYMVRMVVTWLTTLLTIDRWIAVSRPLQAQRVITRRNTIIQIILVFLGAIIFNIPRFFEYGIFQSSRGGVMRLRETDFSTNIVYTITYKITLFLLCFYVIPVIILLVLNTKLIRALRSANQERLMIQHNATNIAQQNRSVTIIVVSVVMAFLICNIVALCAQIIYSIELAYPSMKPYVEDKRRTLAMIGNLMVTLNSAINFLIYCTFSKLFRKTFWEMFNCQKINQSRQAKRTPSSASGLTYLSLTRSRSSSSSAQVKHCDKAHSYA